MEKSFVLQYLSALNSHELERFEKYLLSPYHNVRTDTLILFRVMRDCMQREAQAFPAKEALFAEVYVDRPYSNLEMNNLLSYLTQDLREFLALEQWRQSPNYLALPLLNALRDHQMDQQFERNWRILYNNHQATPLRNAGWFMMEYQLQNELFRYQVMKEPGWHENFGQITDSLCVAFALESVRWHSTANYIEKIGKEAINMSLALHAEQYMQSKPQASSAAFTLFAQNNLILKPDSTVEDYRKLRKLTSEHLHLITAEESREVYMAAINFCIRQINQGERSYTDETFKLYKEALENKALLHRGSILLKSTYHNIHVLAHLCGDPEWAKKFLDTYQKYLPKDDGGNYYRYNLALYSFMLEDYSATLRILLNVHFNELYLNLEVRIMMLRAYFETKQWKALDSLLGSFSLFVRRHKELGERRERYLELIKFTKKLLKLHTISLEARKSLLQQAKASKAVADREWVIKKLEQSIQ